MTDAHVRVRVAGDEYALAVGDVVEVDRQAEVTPVPGARPEIVGIRNVHGQLVPVVDLAALVQVEPDADPGWIVVVANGERRAALSVGSVVEVGPVPPPTEGMRTAYLRGEAIVGSEPVHVVDVPALLDALAGGGGRP
jgi:purine-binding chemotaxis protein CheW